jgi:hypothetical protein
MLDEQVGEDGQHVVGPEPSLGTSGRHSRLYSSMMFSIRYLRPLWVMSSTKS